MYYALAYSGVRVSVVTVGIIALGIYTGAYGPAYLVGGLLFFCMRYPLSLVAGKWEQKLKQQDNAGTAGKEEA